MNEEESKLGQIIKPEYLRPQTEVTEMPTSVKWRVSAHSSEMTSLTFNRDGSVMYTGGGDGMVKAWDTATGRSTQSY